MLGEDEDETGKENTLSYNICGQKAQHCKQRYPVINLSYS